jgi:hypothetical protein
VRATNYFRIASSHKAEDTFAFDDDSRDDTVRAWELVSARAMALRGRRVVAWKDPTCVGPWTGIETVQQD